MSYLRAVFKEFILTDQTIPHKMAQTFVQNAAIV